jgi:soluble lytic murein transglycosylase-like protein
MRSTVLKKLLWLAFYSLPFIAFVAHGTEPRAEVVSPQSAQKLSLPVKVMIYESHRAQLAALPRLPADPLKLRSDKPSAQEVKAYVQTQATEYGVNPKLALWIVKHESEFNPRASGDREASR